MSNTLPTNRMPFLQVSLLYAPSDARYHLYQQSALLFLYGNAFNRLPRVRRLLQLTAAAGSDPTPPLGRSRWTRKANNNPFSPPGFPQHPGLPRAPTNSTVAPARLLHTVQNTTGLFQTHIITMLNNWAASNHAGADQQRSCKRGGRLKRNPTFYVRKLSHPHT